MKETVNVNIGSVAFILDEDAYRVLGSYFDDIRRRLPEGDAETDGRHRGPCGGDIPRAGRLAHAGHYARRRPCDDGPDGQSGRFRRTRGAERSESAEGGTGTESAEQPPLRKLYRSRTERSIAGICGGLAAYFDSDPTLIRLLMLLLILFGGLSIWAYIILWIVIPEEPARKFNINSKNR